MIITATVAAAVLSYGGTIMLGIPAYLWLRKRQIVAFWAWPALGFGVGAVTALGLLPLAVLSTMRDSYNSAYLPGLLTAVLQLLLLAGFSGALVGTAHRLIAPPRKNRAHHATDSRRGADNHARGLIER